MPMRHLCVVSLATLLLLLQTPAYGQIKPAIRVDEETKTETLKWVREREDSFFDFLQRKNAEIRGYQARHDLERHNLAMEKALFDVGLLIPKSIGGPASQMALGGFDLLRESHYEGRKGYLERALQRDIETGLAFSFMGTSLELQQIIMDQPSGLEAQLFVSRVGDTLLGGLHGKAREAAQDQLQEAFDEGLAGAVNNLNQVDRLTDQEVASLKQRVHGFSKALTEIDVEMNDRFNELLAENREINAELRAQHADDMQFVKDFMFKRMSPNERERAIKEGKFDHKSVEWKKKELEKIKLVKRRLQNERDIQEFFQTGDQIIQLAARLGADSDLVNAANTALGAGKTMKEVYDLLSVEEIPTLNYLKAANLLLSFGGGGMSADAARHQEIMNKLNVIEQKVDQVLLNQKHMFEALGVLIEGQQLTYERLNDFAETTQRNFDDVFERLDGITEDLYEIRSSLGTLLEAEYGRARCESFMTNVVSTAPYEGYESLSRVLTGFTNQSDFRRCYENVRALFSSSFGGTHVFALRSYPGRGEKAPGDIKFEAIDPFIEDIFEPTYLAFTRIHADSLDYVLEGLRYPARDTKRLGRTAVLRDISYLDTDEFRAFRIEENLLANPVATTTLRRYVDFALALSPYLHYYDGENERIYTPEAFAQTGYRAEAANELLEKTLAWIDLAIAQEYMFSGGLLIPVFYKALNETVSEEKAEKISSDLVELRSSETPCGWQTGEDKEDEDREIAAVALCILERNSVLARNYLRYALGMDLERNRQSNDAFALALSRGGDPFMLHTVTQQPDSTYFPWTFSYPRSSDELQGLQSEPNRWYAKLGQAYYPLPTADQLSTNELTYRMSMDELQIMRRQVIETMGYHEMYASLSDSERRLVDLVYVSSTNRQIVP